MKLKVNNTDYMVFWHHTIGVGTTCVITTPSQSAMGLVHEVVANGENKIGKNEKSFNKDKGRKISLTRALKQSYLNKEERGWFWNNYYKMRGNKW